MKFHEKRLKNLKPSDDMFLCFPDIKNDESCKEEIKPIFERKEVIEKINFSKLKVKSDDELKVLLNMLVFITKKSTISCFKYNSFEKGKEEHKKMIEFLKFGVLK